MFALFAVANKQQTRTMAYDATRAATRDIPYGAKYNGQYTGAGRVQPATSQSSITLRVKQLAADIERKKAARRPLYPAGDDGDHAINIGYLLFQAEHSSNSIDDMAAPNAIQVSVFSCANGLTEFDRFKFVGVAKADAVMFPGTPQAEFTADIGGTQTIVNTGDRVIQQGMMVMWDWPCTVRTPDGSLAPKGAINGFPETMFPFSTKPCDSATVFTQFSEIEMEVAKWMKDKHRAVYDNHNQPGDLPGFVKSVVEAGRALAGRHSLVAGHRKFDPAVCFAMLCALGYLPHAARANLSEDDVKATYGAMISDEATKVVGYQLHLAQLMQRSAAPRGKDSDVKTAQWNPRKVSHEQLAMTLVLEQNNIMKARIIGKCTRTARPGEQLDILLM